MTIWTLPAQGALVSYYDVNESAQLNFAAISSGGFTGPTTLLECTFISAAEPAPGDFVITIVEASTTDLSPIVPAPTVSVSTITPQ